MRAGGGLLAQFPAPLKAALRAIQGIAAERHSQGRGELREQPTTGPQTDTVPRRV
ncbi:hypothetical protein GCM10010278_14560 [Streptomyces melanogenes]|nr:hypothetical protein GCM10010278_14560 [Streptomyces melanogenes]